MDNSMEVPNDADVNQTAPSSSSGVLMETASHEIVTNNTSNRTPFPYVQTTYGSAIIPTILSSVSVVKNLKKKRMSDMERVQKILEELNMKSVQPDKIASGRYKKQKILSDGRILILQYAKELSSTIIEEAALLAKHRGVNEMSVKDVKLILGKKFGIDGSGYIPRGKRVSAGKSGALDEDAEVIEADLLEIYDIDIVKNDEVRDDHDKDIILSSSEGSEETNEKKGETIGNIFSNETISNAAGNKESGDLKFEEVETDVDPGPHRGGKGLMLS